MKKIPIGDTISRAYGFAFSNFFWILGVAWLPYVLLAGIAAGLVLLVAPDIITRLMHGDFDPYLFLRAARFFALIGVLQFIVTAMVLVGIQRQALGLHKGPVFVWFSLGAPVWRMAGAIFLAILVIGAVAIATVFAVVALWFAFGAIADPWQWIARGLMIVAAICWMFYLSFRLTFFLPSVVVAENRIGLGRAWELGGGSFWRMLIVTIGVLLPAVIGFGIIASALFGPFLPFPTNFGPHMDPHEIVRMIFSQFRYLGPFVILFQVIERIVLMGLLNGATASAYQAVTDRVPE